ncbi:DTW domain-containing protein [Myxococcota bacterium]|nr:DTW domain-containing protein [Myxococcota bacterium]MBU1379680.1 DTW domain-containing protein [Myxococcota bacterium]MBU1496891.1 DTW domain-containing protein [Myxococcota bacterium]
MGRKRLTEETRCPDCLLNRMHCYCHALQTTFNRTKITAVLHYSEVFLTSNTAHLLKQTLSDARLFVRNSLGIIENSETFLAEDFENIVLFPADHAIPLENMVFHKPVHLIIPDGSWNQAKKMYRKDPILSTLRAVSITPRGPSRYFLRRQGRENGLCTYEAVACALGILEGEKVYSHMMAQFETAMNAIHASRNNVSTRDHNFTPVV